MNKKQRVKILHNRRKLPHMTQPEIDQLNWLKDNNQNNTKMRYERRLFHHTNGRRISIIGG